MFILTTVLLFGKTNHTLSIACLLTRVTLANSIFNDHQITSCVIPPTGFASTQKVIRLFYCALGEDHLRMDCKYSLPAESSEVFCKYTQGARLLDTTDPEEEQHAPFKNRVKVRIFPGNNCRMVFRNLPTATANFTCNIRSNSVTASKTSVVERSKLLVPTSCYFACKKETWASQTKFSWLFLIQRSSSPARPGVSCYKAAVAHCWPWWLFPCCWKFTSCEEGAKLMHMLTSITWWLTLDSPEVLCMHKVQWVELNVRTVYIWYYIGLRTLHYARNTNHTYCCEYFILCSTLTYLSEQYVSVRTCLTNSLMSRKHEWDLILKLKSLYSIIFHIYFQSFKD